MKNKRLPRTTKERADADYLLANQLGQGDSAAFGVLVEKYKQPIINFASRFLGDPIEAHDVAQNVFVQVLKRANHFQCQSRFSTWLYAIARNLCRNEYRRRLRQRTELFDSFSLDYYRSAQRPKPEDLRLMNIPEAVFARELQQKLEESLASLPEHQRTAILLLHEHDLSYEEIASLIRMSVSATKGLIYRARQELKRQLRPYLRTGAWAAKVHSPRVPKSPRAPGSLARGAKYSLGGVLASESCTKENDRNVISCYI